MAQDNSQIDGLFMHRALSLAEQGRGWVSPNPLVGSVIVHDGNIIGEGWHRKYGEPHAEVNAINNVANKKLLAQSTLYVNLEPCSHSGKTPPCADLLITHNIKRVVVANLDSNPLVSGDGVKKLRAAGIEVVTGIMEAEGRLLNVRFFTYMEKQRPYIILKWAQTADGFMARENYDSKWISNVYSRQLTHKWRFEEDAILVGTNTALRDNPQLTVRDWSGKNPTRVVIDRYLKLPPGLAVFDQKNETILYNTIKQEALLNLSYVQLDDSFFLENLIKDLYTKKIQSVLVEGGPTILKQFIGAGLWDEARVFQSAQQFGTGITAPMPGEKRVLRQLIQGDELSIYRK